jgi:hypothetical protein
MNERIKEMMEQSMPAIDWKARNGVELNNGERLKHMTDWFDKFAQLIVEDCIDICENEAASAQAQQKSVFLTDEGRQLYSGAWGGAKGCAGAIKSLMLDTGVDAMAGDGGYEIGTDQGQQAFEDSRNHKPGTK